MVCSCLLVSSNLPYARRLSVWKPKRMCGNRFYENFESDMTAIVPILSLSMVHSKTKREILCYAWNIWTSGRWTDMRNKEDIADGPSDLSTAFLKISALFESMCWERSPSPSWLALSTYTKPTASCIVISSRPISYSIPAATSSSVTLVLLLRQLTRLPIHSLALPHIWLPNEFREAPIRSVPTCGAWA